MKKSHTNYKLKIPFFTKKKTSFFDSTSFTLIHEDVFSSIQNFYSLGSTKNNIGVSNGSYQATKLIDEFRKKLKSFLSFSNGEIFFPLSRGIGLLNILHSLNNDNNLTVFAYSGLDHDLLLPIYEYTKEKFIQLITIPYFTNDKELFTHLTSAIHKSNRGKKSILVLSLRSLGNGYELSNTTLKDIKAKFGISIVLDCTNTVCTSKYDFFMLTFDFALMDSNIGFGGPPGQGIVLIQNEYLNLIKPYLFAGNNSIKEVSFNSIRYDEFPANLESGINPFILSGMSKSIDVIENIGLDLIEQLIRDNMHYLISSLKLNFQNVIIVGSGELDDYHNIASIIFPEQNMHEIAIYLDEIEHIEVRSGSLCAHQLIDQIYVKHIGKNFKSSSEFGIIQFSLHYYVSKEDIDNLIEGISNFMEVIN